MRMFFLIFMLFALPAQAAVVSDIAYGSDKLQKLDVYTPEQCLQARCPVVIWVHGGGWRNGDKTAMGSEDAPKIAALWGSRGAVLVSINYRLTPAVMHPAHVQDVAAAINWTNKNIDRYGGNSSRIYLLGHSAGAHLIALVATDPQYLAAYGLSPAGNLSGVFPIDAPAYNLAEDLGTPLVSRRIKDAFDIAPQALRSASPAYNAKPGGAYPPFIIATTRQHPRGESSMNDMANRLRRAGGQVDTYVADYPGQLALKAHRSIAEDLYNPDSPMTIRLMAAVGLTQ